MKKILFYTIRCAYVIYPYSLHLKIREILNYLYSCWVSNTFEFVGHDTLFEYKVHVKGGNFIKIGSECIFHRDTIIEAWNEYQGYNYAPNIEIGNGCSFGVNNHITACKEVRIGNNLLTGAFVIITDNNHGEFSINDLQKPPRERVLSSKGGVYIGDNVWIGDKVTILSGIHIGEGAIIAANSVVNKDIPPFSLVAGSPAKVIKTIKDK